MSLVDHRKHSVEKDLNKAPGIQHQGLFVCFVCFDAEKLGKSSFIGLGDILLAG